MVNNPFFSVTPLKKDMIVGRKEFLKNINKEVMSSLIDNKIIIIKGDSGMGKSFFVRSAVDELKTKKSIKLFNYDFSLDLINKLRKLPDESKIKKQIVVVIDRFELMLMLSEQLQTKIFELMTELCKTGITFLITSSDDLIEKTRILNLELKKYFKTFNVPGLTYEEAEDLVINRLNMERKKDLKSIEPFTVKELKEVYKNSKGNPRIILMLCGVLFDNKF